MFKIGDGVGCNGCHSAPDTFSVADVPDPVEAEATGANAAPAREIFD